MDYKKIFPTSFILLFAIFLLLGCTQSNNSTVPNSGTTTDGTSNASPKTVTVNITANGFEPKEATINAGDTVKFVNKDSAEHWPASAMHPTHTVYPGSDIKKCGTTEEKNIFDACKGLAQEESFSFTFNSKGTWAYHDHLNPTMFGKIIVQ